MAQFCSQCGTKINGNDRYCTQCGTALRERQIASPQERVYLVTAGTLKRGLIKSTTYSLIITEKRLAFVLYDKKVVQDIAKQIAEEAKSQGKGLLGRMGAQLQTGSKYLERYYKKPVSESLAESSENFYLEHQIVSSVKLELGGTRYRDSETTTTVPTIIKIVTPGEKYQFRIQDLRVNGDLKKVFRNIYAGKIKVTG